MTTPHPDADHALTRWASAELGAWVGVDTLLHDDDSGRPGEPPAPSRPNRWDRAARSIPIVAAWVWLRSAGRSP